MGGGRWVAPPRIAPQTAFGDRNFVRWPSCGRWVAGNRKLESEVRALGSWRAFFPAYPVVWRQEVQQIRQPSTFEGEFLEGPIDRIQLIVAQS